MRRTRDLYTLLIAKFVEEATYRAIRRRFQAATAPVSLLQHFDFLDTTTPCEQIIDVLAIFHVILQVRYCRRPTNRSSTDVIHTWL